MHMPANTGIPSAKDSNGYLADEAAVRTLIEETKDVAGMYSLVNFKDKTIINAYDGPYCQEIYSLM